VIYVNYRNSAVPVPRVGADPSLPDPVCKAGGVSAQDLDVDSVIVAVVAGTFRQGRPTPGDTP
jgi:hypothetical protein